MICPQQMCHSSQSYTIGFDFSSYCIRYLHFINPVLGKLIPSTETVWVFKVQL